MPTDFKPTQLPSHSYPVCSNDGSGAIELLLFFLCTFVAPVQLLCRHYKMKHYLNKVHYAVFLLAKIPSNLY